MLCVSCVYECVCWECVRVVCVVCVCELYVQGVCVLCEL